MRIYSKNKVYCWQFAVSRTTTSCSSRMERHARHSPQCRLPAFQHAWVHWTRKLAAEHSRSKSRGFFSVDNIVADGVTSQNFRHWSAAASSHRLLGQDTLNRAIYQLPKRLRIVIKAKGGHVKLSRLTICVRDRYWFTVFWMKIEQNACHCQIQCNFWGIDDLCKLGKEYLTALTRNLSISF